MTTQKPAWNAIRTPLAIGLCIMALKEWSTTYQHICVFAEIVTSGSFLVQFMPWYHGFDGWITNWLSFGGSDARTHTLLTATAFCRGPMPFLYLMFCGLRWKAAQSSEFIDTAKDLKAVVFVSALVWYLNSHPETVDPVSQSLPAIVQVSLRIALAIFSLIASIVFFVVASPFYLIGLIVAAVSWVIGFVLPWGITPLVCVYLPLLTVPMVCAEISGDE